MSLLISFYTLHKSFGIVNHGRSVKKLMGIQKTSVKYIRIAMILTSAMVVQAILILTLGLIGGTRGTCFSRKRERRNKGEASSVAISALEMSEINFYFR